MRATLHCGRANSRGQVYKAKHNDRQFDYWKEPHIDATETRNNHDANCVPVTLLQEFPDIHCSEKESKEIWQMDFTQAEKLFYRKVFGKWLDRQNEKHEKSRHHERVKTMEQIYNNKKFAPDENIIQYGDRDKHPPVETLKACYDEYFDWHEKKYGEHIRVLNFSVHVDEKGGTPHVHERKVYFAKNADGIYEINQQKALENYYSLPEGTEKSRYNNLKQQYTAECREKWEEIGREHGLEIAYDRLPPRKHKEKNEYIIEQQEKKISSLREEISALRTDVEMLNNEKEMLERAIELTKQKKLDEIDALLEQAWADYATVPLLRESIREYERDFTSHVEQAYEEVFDEKDMARARARSEALLEPKRTLLDKKILEASKQLQKSQEQAHRLSENLKKKSGRDR